MGALLTTRKFWRAAFYLLWTGLLIWVLVAQILPLFQVAGLLGAASVLVFLLQLALLGTPLLLVVLQLRGPSFGRWLALLAFSLAGGLLLLLYLLGQQQSVAWLLVIWPLHLAALLVLGDKPRPSN